MNSALDRLALTIVRIILGLFAEFQRKERIKDDADSAADKAAGGDPSEAERFIREHGGPR